MRVCVLTQGCKVNRSESGALEEELEGRGHALVAFGEEVDAVVLNTCTVTHRSDRDARALIRRARRANPGARIVVTGCLAQVAPEELRGLGVDAVVGTAEKATIPDLLERGAEGSFVGDVARVSVLAPAGLRRLRGRTRAFFKVQEGCDAFCAYCIVPYARGPSRSLPLEAVKAGLAELRRGGNAEVVLTGVHLGLWGRDLSPPRGLGDLLDAAEDAGISRVRLSSLEPREVTGEVIRRLASSPVLCPHLHIPLQSGSDRVLRAMGRPYTAGEFRATVERAHREVEGLCVGLDVIAGFPGEDDADFRETRALLVDLPFAYLHVFPFSPRQGTRAWDLPERIPEGVIRDRAAALRALSAGRRRAFLARNLGRVLGVLPEGEARNGRLQGTTTNYVSVSFPWEGAAPSGEVPVELIRVEGEAVMGRPARSAPGGGPWT
ncbi:MAG: tRNA (N(6)-L-threonylcarbamoyladenosine(37)-C(2))-methylthiotransferase MtaB [Deltaproteobacteria bacterium]|nr:tRNA (N(6)-L-threonylcarbamoyladenosine(37)-C(2))-methylthiotransferase MtaB [Deltaproteobacteria bacterium]